jgi:hypothetical protein
MLGEAKMVRYLLTVAGALALMSNFAFAQTNACERTTVIHKSSPDGMAHKKVVIKRNDDGFGASKKVVIKRHDDRYGALVTKKKIVHGDHMAGSSMGGTTVVKKRTFGY